MSAEKDGCNTAADHPPIDRRTMNSTMHLSKDEMRLLRECNRESFYYRSLPLAVTAMAATQAAVKAGLLKSHPRWGSFLKLVGASFVGWILGKISYRSVCEDKFLQLQNSQIGDAIRKKRGFTLETFKDDSSSGSGMLYADDAPTYSVDDDYTSTSRSLNLDTDKNIQYSGLDDSDRPTGDEYDIQPEVKTPKYSTTYEDLRRQNREEYELRQSKLFQPPSRSSSVPPSSPPPAKDWRNFEDKPPSRQSSYWSESPGLKNAYGDRWEK